MLAEALPAEDASIDVVISNGVINLCPDKMAAMQEIHRVLKPGGVFLLNIKDHIRGGELQHVAGWHVTQLCRLGFTLLCDQEVNTPALQGWVDELYKAIHIDSVRRQTATSSNASAAD